MRFRIAPFVLAVFLFWAPAAVAATDLIDHQEPDDGTSYDDGEEASSPADDTTTSTTQNPGELTERIEADFLKDTGGPEAIKKTLEQDEKTKFEDAGVPLSEILPTTSTTATAASQTKKITYVLRGLDALTELFIPRYAEREGLDEVKKSDTVLNGSIAGYYEWKKDEPIPCVDVKVSYSLTAKFPIDGDDVTAHVLDENKIFTQWDLDDDSSVSGSLNLNIGHGDSWSSFYCWAIDAIAVVGDNKLTLKATDFAGKVKTRLVGGASAVTITDAETYNFDFALDLDGSGVLGSAIELLLGVADIAYKIEDFFGVTDCSSVESCAEEFIEAFLNTGDMKEKIIGTLNDAFSSGLHVADGDHAEGVKYRYNTGLYSLRTDGGDKTLTTLWTTRITLSGEDEDDCAAALTGYSPASPETSEVHEDVSGFDIGVAVPASLIAETVYTAAKSGLFCEPLEDAMPSEGMSWGEGSVDFQMLPFGEVAAIIPENTDGEEHAHRILFVIPVRFEDFVLTATSPLGTSEKAGSGNMTAKLVIAAKVEMKENSLSLDLSDATFKKFSGAVTFGSGLSLGAADFETNPPSPPAFGDIALPTMTKISELEGVSLELEKAFFAGDTLHLGLSML